MILVCGGIKGGVGKTTIATHGDSAISPGKGRVAGGCRGLTFLESALGNRKAYRRAGAQESAMMELTRRDKKAISEIEPLFQQLFDLKPSPK